MAKFTVLDETAIGAQGGRGEQQRAPGQPQQQQQGGTVPGVSFADSDIRAVRGAIAELYSGFKMTKTQTHETWGVYKALIDSMTGSNTTKYICAIVPNDRLVPLGSQIPLRDLPWISFQARTTANPRLEFAGFPMKEQQYAVRRNTILFDKIKLAHEYENKWVYVPDHLPLTVDVMLTKPDENFAPEGTVVSALELFQTVINLEMQQ
jgi:hypothetical protein